MPTSSHREAGLAPFGEDDEPRQKPARMGLHLRKYARRICLHFGVDRGVAGPESRTMTTKDARPIDADEATSAMIRHPKR